jgi:AraC-like DNA-binding protein
MTSAFPPPPLWPAALTRVRAGCDRLRETIPEVTVAGTRLGLRALRPFVEEPGGGLGRHSHSFYELVGFLDGEARQMPEETPLTPGLVLIRHPQQLHAWQPVTRVVRLVLSFELQPRHTLPSPVPSDAAARLLGDLLRALEEVDSRRPGWEERARCLVTLVGSTLVAAGVPLPGRPARLSGIPENLATEVDEFLRDNLAHPLRLRDLARQFGLSERALTQQYARLSGDSIMARLRRLRLEAAAELLRCTDASLAEIGQRVGLPDSSYFCRCYKRQFGHPPSRHRRP